MATVANTQTNISTCGKKPKKAQEGSIFQNKITTQALPSESCSTIQSSLNSQKLAIKSMLAYS
jgi:hypothetical protein